MPRPTRRRFLMTTGALLTGGLARRPACAVEAGKRQFKDAADRGRRFLASLLDPALDLLPEFRGSKTYWLYHDNYLAAKVLDPAEPGLAMRIRDAIKKYEVTASGKIEILFGEAKHPLPFRHHRLVEVGRLGQKLLKTEVVGENVQSDWAEYADLLSLAAIAEAGRDRDEALRQLRANLAIWDGTGFKDRVNRGGGPYATYKLALALIAAERVDRHAAPEGAMLERLLAVQRDDGGFVTDYTPQGRPVGEANVETTALAVLALDRLS